jgi:hypothetical protein
VLFSILCLAIGGLDILFYWILGGSYIAANPMFILKPAGGVAPLYGPVIFAMATVLSSTLLIIYEFIFRKPAERFYKNWTKDYWLNQ